MLLLCIHMCAFSSCVSTCFQPPFQAFCCFTNLLNSPFFHVFLKLDQKLMEARYRIFEELFAEYMPDLCKSTQHTEKHHSARTRSTHGSNRGIRYAPLNRISFAPRVSSLVFVCSRCCLMYVCRHFQNEGIGPELYFMEWCMTLFCKRLKLDVVGRVWDCYLISGETTVYRTAVGQKHKHTSSGN